MLGQSEKRIYLNISEGKIVRRIDQRVEMYDFIEGELERIYPKEREFRGEKVPYWYLDIRDNGELYSLGVRAMSGVWRSLILSLGSITNFLLPVRISPYRRGDYDRVSVYSGGIRQDWVSDLPPVEQIEVQGQILKSTAKRDEYISKLVDQINSSLGVEEKGPNTPKRVESRSRSSVSMKAILDEQ